MARHIKDTAEMCTTTKDQADTKRQEVSETVGYPDRWRADSGITVARRDYFGNFKRVPNFELHLGM